MNELSATKFGVQKVDDLMLRRFLRARDLDVEKASEMFLRYLKWRQTFVPNDSISLSQVPNEVAQNKMFLQGFDKQGRPISVVLGARHFQYQGSLDEFKRIYIYICSHSQKISNTVFFVFKKQFSKT